MNWILTPGLGCDHRLFSHMVDLLPLHQVIELVVPHETESIEAYASRLAGQIRATGPYVLCGVSFGGMLSSILCQELDPAAVVLISSTASPRGLSNGMRVFEWLNRVWPDTFSDWIHQLGEGHASWIEPLGSAQAQAFREMVQDAPLDLVRGGARLIMNWHIVPKLTCPSFHLHGSRDVMIPPAQAGAKELIEDAGHLAVMTHPAEVRQFIARVAATIE
jgi:pimeloyl-ACP methyl ester carboxylesterase